MAKPFDATLNVLIDAHAGDWAAFLADRAGLPPGPVEKLLDTDLSVTAQSDKLFRIGGPTPYVLHLELESTGRLGIPTKLLRYNVPTHGLYGLPVHSVLVLLRPKATASDLTGALELSGADGRPYLTFRYTVVRVWQESFDRLLSAGLGLAPLSLLTNDAAADLDAAFGRFLARLREPDVPAKVVRELVASTGVLCGLRYDAKRVEALYRSLSMTLEDSSVYQWALDRGMAEGLAQGVAQGVVQGVAQGVVQGIVQERKDATLRLGTKRFGPPSPPAAAALEAVADPERLIRIADRLLDAAGWDELLETP